MKAAWFAMVAAGVSLSVLPAVAQNLPASCGPKGQTLSVKTTKGEHPPIQPAPGKATLVFVNSEPDCLGCSTVNVGVDGKWIGGNKGDSWFAIDVAPGERHVCAYANTIGFASRYKVRLTELNAEAGQIYFFATDIFHNSGANAGALRLRAVSPDEGNFLVSQSSLASWTPKGH
jgi:hypothetical protein